ncbi:MAG: hypothetical protein SFY69_03040 [Planctomycetota bacterium]|nr:hypothetical protein [Planctomycetota bacterium]
MTGVLTSAATPPAPRAEGVGPLLLWLGVLIGVVVVLGLVVVIIRRRTLASDRSNQAERTLMEGLRELRDSGKMTEEEYAAARRSMAARMAGKPRPTTRGDDRPERDAHG